MLLGLAVKTARSCQQGPCAENRSMNVTFQSGAMGHRISAQKMYMCRMGFPVVTVPTAIKRTVLTMMNSAGRFLVKVQRVHLRVAVQRSTPWEAIQHK